MAVDGGEPYDAGKAVVPPETRGYLKKSSDKRNVFAPLRNQNHKQ